MSRGATHRAAALIAFLLVAPTVTTPQIVPFPTPQPGVARHALDPVTPTTVDAVEGGIHSRETVRIKGKLDRLGTDDRYRELRDGMARLLVIVVPELNLDVRSFLGRRVEVVGFVRPLEYEQGTCRFLRETVPASFCLDTDLPPTPDLKGHADWPQVSITIWSVGEDLDSDRAGRRPGDGASRLADLLATSDVDSDITVVGRFCGAGLCGRPASPAPDGRAWLLQDGDAAVWIVGKEARGRGWRLDPAYPGDSSRWLEVTGRFERCGTAQCLRAKKIALAAPPND
jgi:hypothetical protein